MLDKTRPDTLKQHFEDSVKALDRIIRKARLMRKVEKLGQKSKTAPPEELAQILADLKTCRKQLKELG